MCSKSSADVNADLKADPDSNAYDLNTDIVLKDMLSEVAFDWLMKFMDYIVNIAKAASCASDLIFMVFKTSPNI